MHSYVLRNGLYGCDLSILSAKDSVILNSRPSHVAILVRSVQKAAEYLRPFGFLIGPEEVWEGEGTKEIYVEREKANLLLLMEPIKPGAYRRALESEDREYITWQSMY